MYVKILSIYKSFLKISKEMSIKKKSKAKKYTFIRSNILLLFINI